MHMGETTGDSERIDHLVLRLSDPSAIVRVFPIVDRRPTNTGGL